MESTKELLTETETAKQIGFSQSYLRKARMAGNKDNGKPAPKFLKIGRAIRYRHEDIREWLNSFTAHEHLLLAEKVAHEVSAKKELQSGK